MKKKKMTIPAVILGIVLVLACIAGSALGVFEKVAKPEITEGEFDFSLTYEVDGTINEINGTYVCKFDGINRALDGMGLRWIGYIKNHDGSTDYELKTTAQGVIKVDLDICAEFFMSDPSYKLSDNTDDPKPEPSLYIESGNTSVENPANEVHVGSYEGDDVKIISFEYDPPIENTYN